jgi:3-oxoadipate enol-lactonase
LKRIFKEFSEEATMALQLKGDHKVPLDREHVWCLLNSPVVLEASIPGCNKLIRTGEDQYELALGLVVGSVSGNYKGSVVLSDKKTMEYYDLTLMGEGSIGFVKGAAHFVLTQDGDETTITYDGQADVGGLVAGVGNRVLGGVAKFMVKRFFKAFDAYIKDHDVSGFVLANAGESRAGSSGAPAGTSIENVDVGGATLRVLVDGKEGAPWVVMSHSILADSRIFEDQVAALRDKFRVLRIDTRGHGGSEASAPPYDMALLVHDVVAVLDHFHVEKAHFLGLSLGGMIGYGLALAHPERVASFVSVSASAAAAENYGPVWNERIAVARKEGTKALAAPTVERWFPAPGFLAAHPDVRANVSAAVEGVSVAGFEGCARALQGLDYLKDVARIRVPVLLVAGALDLGMLAAMRDIHGKIPQSRFEVIDNSGHIPTMDNPVEFNRIVVPFLEKVVGIG